MWNELSFMWRHFLEDLNVVDNPKPKDEARKTENDVKEHSTPVAF